MQFTNVDNCISGCLRGHVQRLESCVGKSSYARIRATASVYPIIRSSVESLAYSIDHYSPIEPKTSRQVGYKSFRLASTFNALSHDHDACAESAITLKCEESIACV